MATSVVMPALEMAQETGKIVSWLKKEGDTITKGEALSKSKPTKPSLKSKRHGDGVLAGVKQTKATSCRSADDRMDCRARRKAACRRSSGSNRPRHDVGPGSSCRPVCDPKR